MGREHGTVTVRQPRPIIEDLQYSSTDRGVLLVSGCVVAAAAVVLSALWPDLPERVPMHFSFSGTPDSWGPRVSLLFPIVILVPVNAVLLGLLRVPHTYNYPVPVTDENARELYTVGRRAILLVQAFVNVSICSVVVLAALVANGTLHSLPLWWLLALLGSVPTLVIWIFVASRAAARR